MRSAKLPPLPEYRKSPGRRHASTWLCTLAAAQDIDLQRLSLSEAADCAISHLEYQRDTGMPLIPATVQLASLLVRLEGEALLSDASSTEPFIERAYARTLARWLATRLEASLRVWTRPGILPLEPEPEPELPSETTVYDLIRLCESINPRLETLATPLEPGPRGWERLRLVASIMVQSHEEL